MFLRAAAAFGSASWIGCTAHRGERSSDAVDAGAGGLPSCDVEPDAGAFEIVPFEAETGPFGAAEGAGLEGRLYTDLAELDADHLITDNQDFYVRTRYPDLLDPAMPWSVTLGGLVEAPVMLGLEELLALEADQGVHLLECSGNFRARGFGLLSAAAWSGVPLAALLERVQPLPSAARVLVTGFDQYTSGSGGSTPGASWILSPDQWRATGAFLATRMNGVPLPLDHGYPLRLFNPGWYGCSAVKWVQSIDWVADDAASTSQMLEYASRTQQVGVPALARDYAAPQIEQAAMPVRIEKHRGPSGVCYRVVGILWGGAAPVRELGVSFDAGQQFESLSLTGEHGNASWSLWSLDWLPPAPGRYTIQCRIESPSVPTRRLDAGYYARSVAIDEV
jgi:DMSO/TMAO reductase YedYZ molybdopterin-dependent catalytic subunit